MHDVLVAEVVEAALLEDLGTGAEPHGLAEGHTVAGEDLGGHAAEGAEHGPAGVDDLQLAVAGEGLGVSRQAGRVPAVVTGELACGDPTTAPVSTSCRVHHASPLRRNCRLAKQPLTRQVRRGLAREGAQEEAAVGAVAGPVRADDLGGRLLGGRALALGDGAAHGGGLRAPGAEAG